MIESAFRISRTQLVLGLVLVCIMNYLVYSLQIAESNASHGYLPLELGLRTVLGTFVSILMLAFLMPTSIQRPSDFFCMFHAVFVVLGYIMFHNMTGKVEFSIYFLTMTTLLIPLILVRSLSLLDVRLSVPAFVNVGVSESLIIVICVIGAAVALYFQPPSAGFGLIDSYDRRLEARSIFTASSPSAYITMMVSNGFTPFLAFIAGFKKQRLLLIISLAVFLAIYYTFGSKAPLLHIGIAYLVGAGIRSGTISKLWKILFIALVLMFAAFIIELILFDTSVFVAESFFRRAFMVPPAITGHYMEMISGEAGVVWSPLGGIFAPNGLAFLVGELYFDSLEANANTSAVVFALGAGGIPGYIAIVTMIYVIFWLLDAAYRSSRNAGLTYVGFIYALLIAEQGATTALVSSGVFFIAMIVVATKRGWRRSLEV